MRSITITKGNVNMLGLLPIQYVASAEKDYSIDDFSC